MDGYNLTHYVQGKDPAKVAKIPLTVIDKGCERVRVGDEAT